MDSGESEASNRSGLHGPSRLPAGSLMPLAQRSAFKDPPHLKKLIAAAQNRGEEAKRASQEEERELMQEVDKWKAKLQKKNSKTEKKPTDDMSPASKGRKNNTASISNK